MERPGAGSAGAPHQLQGFGPRRKLQMELWKRWTRTILTVALVLFCAGGASAQYTRTDLVTNTGTPSNPPDANLVNGWGLVALPTSPFWVSDNVTGVSTLYTGTGAKVPLTVTIPPASGGLGSPTGIVGNTTAGDFKVSSGGKSGKAIFIFSTFDGTISGWNPGVGGTNATIAVPASQTGGAIYTGLAIGSNNGENFLYAADDGPNRKVDVYNGLFQKQDLGPDAFVEPSVPKEFAPYGIQTVTDAQGNETVWVTYTGLSHARSGLVSAQSGFVSAFTTGGVLKSSIHVKGPLHSPWGVALAPADFGPFSNALLVSNNISRGRIAAFNPNTGAFLGVLRDASGKPIEIDGVWAIQFGKDGGPNGAHNQLFFTAGPENYASGTFGVIALP
jgi:uncharacterized protein (TIGR03118 family)